MTTPVDNSDGTEPATDRKQGTQAPAIANPDRKIGRELALSVMCALEVYDPNDEEARAEATRLTLDKPPRGDEGGEASFHTSAASKAGRTFAETLLAAYNPRREELDALIDRVSRRWRLARMDHVDRNVVRLAAAELTAMDTPRAVVLAEAVRLARRYGSETSPKFVNGLVESVAQAAVPPDATPPNESSTPDADPSSA